MDLPNKNYNEYRLIKSNTTEIAKAGTSDKGQRIYEVPTSVERIEVSVDRLSSLDDQVGLNINKSLSNGRQLNKFKPRLPKISQYPSKQFSGTQNHTTEQERRETKKSSYEKGPSCLLDKAIIGHKDVMNRHYLSNKQYSWRGHTQFNTSFISTADAESRFSQYGDEYPNVDDEEVCFDDGSPDFIVLNTRQSRQYPGSALEIDMVSATPSIQKSYTKLPEDIRVIEQVYGGYNSRLPHKLGSFEQLRDSGIYKRTRHLVKAERQMRQWPAGLELSGRSVIDEDLQIKDLKDSEGVPGITDDPAAGRTTPATVMSGRLPPLTDSVIGSPRSNKTIFSPSFYTDYGLKTQRTDLFSGYKRRRKAKSASEAEMEKELEAKARRHIYACQVLSSVKKASKTAHNVSLLRKTLGPSRSPSSAVTVPGHIRHMRPSSNNSTKTAVTLDTSKRSPVAFFIRTRETSNLSRAKFSKSEGLPEISGRTVILGMNGK